MAASGQEVGKIQGEELENDETMFTMVLVAVRRGGAWGFVLRLSVIVVLLVITNQISRQVSLQVGSPALRHESLHSSPWMVETLERRAKLLELEFGDRTPMPTVNVDGQAEVVEHFASVTPVSLQQPGGLVLCCAQAHRVVEHAFVAAFHQIDF